MALRSAIFTCVFLPCFFVAQHNEKDSLFTHLSKTKFLDRSDSLYLKYRSDSALNKIPEHSVEAAKVIYFNISDDNNIKKIKEDLKNKVGISKILKKYDLLPEEDHFYLYVFKPLIIKEYYHKICFQSLVRMTRNDLVFDNTIEGYKEITTGTYFINQDDEDDLEVIYFTEAYQPHKLPEIFSDALYFYQTLTASSYPIYHDAYRLREEPKNKDLRILDSLLEKYPRKPLPPNYPTLTDSLALSVYYKKELLYRQKYKQWDSLRYKNFEKLTTGNKIFSSALKNYSTFLKTYSVIEAGPVNSLLYDRLNLNRLPFRHRGHTSHFFRNLFYLSSDSSIQHHNYELFARTFYYEQKALNKNTFPELTSYREQFYKDINKFYIGQALQSLAKAPGVFERQIYATDYCLSESQLVNSVKQLKTFLETKPKDELMQFYAVSLIYVIIEELDEAKSEHEEYEQWLKKYLEEFPLVKGWMEG